MADSSVSTVLQSAGGDFDAAWRREFTELTRRLAELRPSASSGKANESASWSKKRVEAFNKATCRSISRARDIVLAVEAEANAAPLAKRPSLLLGMEHKKRELERLRRDFRAALLERHRHTLQYDTSQQRQELMDDSEGLREQESSQGVVDSLARSRQVMADQVLRMNSVAVQVLKQDDMLKNTMEEHSGVKGSVGRAQRPNLVVVSAESQVSSLIYIESCSSIDELQEPGRNPCSSNITVLKGKRIIE